MLVAGSLQLSLLQPACAQAHPMHVSAPRSGRHHGQAVLHAWEVCWGVLGQTLCILSLHMMLTAAVELHSLQAQAWPCSCAALAHLSLHVTQRDAGERAAPRSGRQQRKCRSDAADLQAKHAFGPNRTHPAMFTACACCTMMH